MVTRTFPLLVLPYLAICNVLDLFSLKELIQFSFLTKRTQRIASKKPPGKVKIILKAQHNPEFLVRLNNSDTYKFCIFGLSAFQRTKDWKRTRMCGEYILSKTRGNFTGTFWKDNLTGIEKVGTFITGLLKSPITEIELLCHTNDLMRVIDWVSSRQKTVHKCIFDVSSMPAEYLTYLLANLEITGHFHLPESWELVPHPRGLGFMDFSYEWFTVEHLMNMNCQFLHIEHRMIHSKDLNRFLKHWQNGGCSSLRFWRLETFFIDLAKITEGIEVEEVPYTLWRTYSEGRFLKPIKIRGGHQIKRSDGTIGTIFIRRGELFHFAVQPCQLQ